MGKGEEYTRKKRNKAIRKRLRQGAGNTLDFIHGVEAARRRRKAGRRRICEGMCYSLPTPDDPFNDRNRIQLKKRKKNKMQKELLAEVEDASFMPADLENELSEETHISSVVDLGSMNEKKSRKGRKIKPVTEAKDSAIGTCSKKMKHCSDVGCAKSLQTVGDNMPKHRCEMHGLEMREKENQSDVGNSAIGHAKADTAALNEGACQQSIPNLERIAWNPVTEIPIEGTSIDCIGAVTPEDAFRLSLSAVLNAGFLSNIAGKSPAKKKAKADGCATKTASKCDLYCLEAFGKGLDVLGTGGAPGLRWITAYVPAAAAHIAGRVLQSGLCNNPVALFILASAKETLRVRKICGPLKKSLHLCSMSLHAGTSSQQQVERLRTKFPEILVATPDQLCNLIALQAVSISNVSFLVIDGLKSILAHGFLDQLIEIRSQVHPCAQTAVLSEIFSDTASITCRKLLHDPILRVTSDNSVAEHSACITQAVSVFTSEEKKAQKLVKILKHLSQRHKEVGACTGILVLIKQSEIPEKLLSIISAEGYVGRFLSSHDNNGVQPATVLESFRKGEAQVLLVMEDVVDQIDLSAVRVVVGYEFPSTIQLYSQILSGMARCTVNGILHSFCSGSTGPLSSQLVQLLRDCSQSVPKNLEMLAEAASMVQQRRFASS